MPLIFVSGQGDNTIEYQETESPYISVISEPFYVDNDTLAVSGLKVAEKGDYDHLIRQYDWDFNSAKKIMMCESSGNPNAVGDMDTRYYSYGLFQIRALPGRPNPEWLKVPENNIEYAYKIYLQEGRRFGATGGWYNCAKKNFIY